MADPDAMEIEPNNPVSAPDPPLTPAKSNHMWIEKYRPASLSDLLSHHEIIKTIQTLIQNNRLPHLLFCGPPGTGKTSTIIAAAKQMYGTTYKSMILELNASDDRGINVVRDQIKSFASTARMFSKGVKLVILDEADAMTTAAQMALRRVVEKYATNTRFCIICNYVNKIIPALQSRCTKFRFGPLPIEDVKKRVGEIAKVESVDLTDTGMEALLRVGQGDMRRILNVLQSTHMASSVTGAKVDGDAIYANTGAPHPGDIELLWKSLNEDGFQKACTTFQDIQKKRGLALDDVVRELVPHIRKCDMQSAGKMYLYEQLANIEYRLAGGGKEKINVAALVGCFSIARAIRI